jgi:RimJ/RimL family protein N-acetyltransferase
MLATREDRRGQRIALLLGAQAIIHMWEHHGARGFMTGVRADNAPSQALCNKLGVGATDWIYAWCMDKELFGGSSVTK